MPRAPIRLIGVSHDFDTGEPSLNLEVGNDPYIRKAPLTEQQLLNLIKDSTRELELLKERRDLS